MPSKTSAPAAPLEKAVEESREALALYISDETRTTFPRIVDKLAFATERLLAALDADRGEAEALVRAMPSPAAFVARAREVLAARSHTQPLRLDPDALSNVVYPSGNFAAAHQRASGAVAHVLAVNSLAALCDVVEAAMGCVPTATPRDRDQAIADLAEALAKLEVPK